MRRVLVLWAAVATLLVPALPAGAGASCGFGNFTDRATNRIDMKGDCFDPVVARVDPGDEVTFRNLDSHDHTVGGVAGTFGDPHKPIVAGEAVSFRFEEEGVYPFICAVHPGMAGAVVVGDGAAAGVATSVVPVDPAAAAAEKTEAESSSGFPFATLALIAAIVIALGVVATTIVLRRRRALGVAA